MVFAILAKKSREEKYPDMPEKYHGDYESGFSDSAGKEYIRLKFGD